jgi:hypothetical protein
MTPEDAVRRHLLTKLEQYDPEAAEHLSGDFDAAYLKRRLQDTTYWATGWRKWIWIVALTVGLTMLVSPIVTEDIGASAALGGVGFVMSITGAATRWQRKRALYETLTILADPAYEPESPFG